jgi:hypothetical protein
MITFLDLGETVRETLIPCLACARWNGFRLPRGAQPRQVLALLQL